MRRSGYVSNREEVWVKPEREPYPVSYNLTIAINSNSNLKLPITKKEFDIILHTVKSIREYGSQFEILLKVKQSDNNPNFDFLNPQSEYYSLYNYLKSLQNEAFWDIYLAKSGTNKPSALTLIESYSDDEDRDEQEDKNENDKEISAKDIVDDLIKDLGLSATQNQDTKDIKIDDNPKLVEKRKERLKKAKLLLHSHNLSSTNNINDSDNNSSNINTSSNTSSSIEQPPSSDMHSNRNLEGDIEHYHNNDNSNSTKKPRLSEENTNNSII